MTLTTTEDFFTSAPPPPAKNDDPLRAMLMALVEERDAATPRHQQKTLGASDVGHPCLRRMAYGLTQAEETNPDFDPLPSIIGTATHTWLGSAAMHANLVLGRTRYLTETRVRIADDLGGTADLYDCDTATVIDWKVPGNNRFKIYRKDPGPMYRAQVHLYGRGLENAGREVKTVAIALIPRGGLLRSMHVWHEDYNPALADAVIARRDAVMTMLANFDTANDPDTYKFFPIEPYDCVFCPWFNPRPKGPLQCKGDQ